jgi:hypothetical protein
MALAMELHEAVVHEFVEHDLAAVFFALLVRVGEVIAISAQSRRIAIDNTGAALGCSQQRQVILGY